MAEVISSFTGNMESQEVATAKEPKPIVTAPVGGADEELPEEGEITEDEDDAPPSASQQQTKPSSSSTGGKQQSSSVSSQHRKRKSNHFPTII
jgi:hypothetical protein